MWRLRFIDERLIQRCMEDIFNYNYHRQSQWYHGQSLLEIFEKIESFYDVDIYAAITYLIIGKLKIIMVEPTIAAQRKIYTEILHFTFILLFEWKKNMYFVDTIPKILVHQYITASNIAVDLTTLCIVYNMSHSCYMMQFDISHTRVCSPWQQCSAFMSWGNVCRQNIGMVRRTSAHICRVPRHILI